VCLSKLNIKSFYSGVIPLGSGFIESSHGKFPVPAPATVEILKKVPVCGGNFDFEVTTPTGAAIIKTLAEGFGNIPYMEIEKTGYGAGSSSGRVIPNVLRLLKGVIKNRHDIKEENLIILSANIDDSTPEIIGYLIEELFSISFLLVGPANTSIQPPSLTRSMDWFKVILFVMVSSIRSNPELEKPKAFP